MYIAQVVLRLVNIDYWGTVSATNVVSAFEEFGVAGPSEVTNEVTARRRRGSATVAEYMLRDGFAACI